MKTLTIKVKAKNNEALTIALEYIIEHIRDFRIKEKHVGKNIEYEYEITDE